MEIHSLDSLVLVSEFLLGKLVEIHSLVFFCRFFVGKTGGNSFSCFFQSFCWENWWKFILLFFL